MNTACYIRNRYPFKHTGSRTPYKLWKTAVDRNFGSKVISLNKRRVSSKFAPKGIEYNLVGYSEEVKAYRLWEKGTRSIEKKCDVRFLEDDKSCSNKKKKEEMYCTEDAYNAPLLKDEHNDREPAVESTNKDYDREHGGESLDEDSNREDA